jgi:hypothetical protein
MFGPNAQPPDVPVTLTCHRSAAALAARWRVEARFHQLFGQTEYALVWVPGPASLAMQAVLQSLRGPVRVLGEGRFPDRWRGMVRPPESPLYPTVSVLCLLETSTSRAWAGPLPDGPVVVDAVSGFPYAPLPSGAAVWVTTSNKLLGGLPGLALVGVRYDAWDLFRVDAAPTLTNLRNHRAGWFTTAPVHGLSVLEQVWSPGYFAVQRAQIDAVSADLGPRLAGMQVGDAAGPVLTVRRTAFEARFPGVAQAFALYPATRPATIYPVHQETYQIFTYSEPLAAYAALAAALDAAERPNET